MNHNQHHPVVLVHGFAGDGMATWGFQVGALTKCGHDVYVPDLVHFGGSTSRSPDRSVAFQARCLAAALRNLGVAGPCTVVGFSYGGLVALQMAAACPGLVRSVVVSGCTVTYTSAMKDALLSRLSARSITELMLPETVGQLRRLFSTAMHMKVWFPRRLLKDFLKVMYNNRKERAEMLDDMVNMRGKEASAPVFQQNILLLWGENDNFFPIEDGESLKEELGEKATLQTISKAGHLAQLERPCVYNRYLKKFLAAHSPFELVNTSS
uniref:AB hydrolase-1 domain-containing protein n=1 Tax=Triticum urartu TaxID=4572 RepID=A0A8R7Q0J5_TRIUA